MVPDKCYSTNNEDFVYNEMDDALMSAFDDPETKIGTIVTVYEGDPVRFKAGDFTGFTLDTITNTAYDEGGDYAGYYLDQVTKEQEADLDKRIADVVNQWADDYGLQPTFYRVANIKEIRAKLISDSGEYEILGEDCPTCHDEGEITIKRGNSIDPENNRVDVACPD